MRRLVVVLGLVVLVRSSSGDPPQGLVGEAEVKAPLVEVAVAGPGTPQVAGTVGSPVVRLGWAVNDWIFGGQLGFTSLAGFGTTGASQNTLFVGPTLQRYLTQPSDRLRSYVELDANIGGTRFSSGALTDTYPTYGFSVGGGLDWFVCSNLALDASINAQTEFTKETNMTSSTTFGTEAFGVGLGLKWFTDGPINCNGPGDQVVTKEPEKQPTPTTPEKPPVTSTPQPEKPATPTTTTPPPPQMVCGPDVTKEVYATLDQIGKDYKAKPNLQKEACGNLYGVTTYNNAWDIEPLGPDHAPNKNTKWNPTTSTWNRYDPETKTTNNNFMPWFTSISPQCAIPRPDSVCAATVEFEGTCQHAQVVNYVMWGYVNSLCANSLSTALVAVAARGVTSPDELVSSQVVMTGIGYAYASRSAIGGATMVHALANIALKTTALTYKACNTTCTAKPPAVWTYYWDPY